ncbi:hypothetical protein AciPR4_3356 [Terriglobus saanensis SP1PR4]|uniref:Uncharacterized protein n=1 Tax=Terriglobus saanensis (strain ATCC BAA-1853 / DSM 23119 / SP1PR4) TaxID=401053 RepID=E8V8S3_TERSS|nr:hypothetical protein AciPR4_3356 [Terriglobus saanensis SP1PR4]
MEPRSGITMHAHTQRDTEDFFCFSRESRRPSRHSFVVNVYRTRTTFTSIRRECGQV